MDFSLCIVLFFLICIQGVPEEIPLMHSVTKENKDTLRLKQSLKILRDYLMELGVKAQQTTIQTTTEKLRFGPHYPIMDIKEPPMNIPLEGLRDEEIPRNLYFQAAPFSDKEDMAPKSDQAEHGKDIWGKILLPISIATLFVLLILIGCSAIGIYECTKEDRTQYLHQNRASECASNCTQKEYSDAMKIVDEVSSYSDESRSHERSRNVSPSAPQETVKSDQGSKK